MTPRDLQTVEELLKITSKADLIEYFAIDPKAGDVAFKGAIDERRRWAQGQQANPKFRSEALWIIKNQEVLKRVLVDHRPHYLAAVESKRLDAALGVLDQFARGALGDGILTPEKEEAIAARASELGIAQKRAKEFVDELVLLLGAERRTSFDKDRIGSFVDYYQMLEVSPDDTPLQIEEAFRARYRQAEELYVDDEKKTLWKQLEKAYDVLRNKEQRARYDAARLKALGLVTDREARGASGSIGTDALFGDDVQGFLGAPASTTRPDKDPVFGMNEGAAGRLAPVELPADEGKEGEGKDGKASKPVAAGGAPASKGIVQQVRGPPPAESAVGDLTAEAEAPRLTLIGEKQREVRVGWEPSRFTVELSNSGTRPMRGRVASPWAWLEVRPDAFVELEPNGIASFTVVVFPRLMPARTASAQISITTEHGDKRSLQVIARRPLLTPMVAKVVAVGVVSLAAWVAWALH